MEHIRKAVPDDAVRLAEIEIFDYRLNFYPIFKTDKYFFSELNVLSVAQEYRDMPEKTENTAVYDDGIVKGFIRVNGQEIEKLFVEPSFQNEGIGGALMRYALAETEGRTLLVLEKNTKAIRFYERYGFKASDERPRVDDTGEFFIRMIR